MIKLEISNGVKFKLPEGRHEVTYDQWSEAIKQIKEIDEAQNLYESGDYSQSNSKVIRAMSKMIVALSDGNVKEDDLLNCEWDKVNNIFATCFSWIHNEPPKKEFIVNGKTLVIPNFNNTTGLQLMDATAYLQQIDEAEDHEKGLVIATIYTSEKYTQDLVEYEKRKEWLKKYAKLDLFYSCAFFLRNTMKKLPLYIPQPLVVQEVEKLTKRLNALATTLYLLTYQESKSL